MSKRPRPAITRQLRWDVYRLTGQWITETTLRGGRARLRPLLDALAVLGAPFRPSARITEEQQQRRAAIIERAASGVSYRVLADEFGITHQRVSQIVIKLTGKKRSTRNRSSETDWTPALIGRLRADWDAGYSIAAIGRRLGVSKNAVVGKARRLDLPERPPVIRDPDDPRRYQGPRHSKQPAMTPKPETAA